MISIQCFKLCPPGSKNCSQTNKCVCVCVVMCVCVVVDGVLIHSLVCSWCSYKMIALAFCLTLTSINPSFPSSIRQQLGLQNVVPIDHSHPSICMYKSVYIDISGASFHENASGVPINTRWANHSKSCRCQKSPKVYRRFDYQTMSSVLLSSRKGCKRFRACRCRRRRRERSGDVRLRLCKR